MSRMKALILLGFLGAVLASASVTAAQGQESAWAELPLQPETGQLGIFDPSLVAGEAGRHVLSFSAVDPSPNWPQVNDRVVSTFIAVSEDAGQSWRRFPRPVNGVSELVGADRAVTWHHEVSTLVHDPAAPTAQRWRLLWHHYPMIDGERRFEFGWLALKAAEKLEGLFDAREAKLFAGRGYREGSGVGSPVSGPPVLALQALDPELDRCLAFTEPGAFAAAGRLYLVLTCAEWNPAGVRQKVVLLRCAAPCQAERAGAWAFLGTLLRPEDAARQGHQGYTAADLFLRDGRVFLLASPIGDRPFPEAYNGCDVFGFGDLDKARLLRETGGPEVLRRIRGAPGSFHGACAVSNRSGLVLLSQLYLRAGGPSFRILQARTPLAAE